ncbi:MAG: triphosphoribosyl-dephospho-CoA synthase [Candidatus Thermoplasmatota archaeon]|nr:triphosphoribosyl-dephospho-CoA synthase [Candidatus Thermoplasmatota archaeon]
MASLTECSVQKPGNVGPLRDFPDLGYGDFIVSSILLGSETSLVANGKKSFGQGILDYALSAKRDIGTNVHLGTAILLMPLAQAAASQSLPVSEEKLRQNLSTVLRSAGQHDSEMVCRAIKETSPSGLQDPCFRDSPVSTLVDMIRDKNLSYLQWMALGAEKDDVAKETVESYPRCFMGAKMLGLRGVKKNVLPLFLHLLSQNPDTLITGTRGRAVAEEISALAKKAISFPVGQGSMDSVALKSLEEYCEAVDANPGTTADMVCASIYIALLTGGKL